jgi:outer membrane receptor protein involved in Fe transport
VALPSSFRVQRWCTASAFAAVALVPAPIVAAKAPPVAVVSVARYPGLIGGGVNRANAARGPFVHIDVRGSRAHW